MRMIDRRTQMHRIKRGGISFSHEIPAADHDNFATNPSPRSVRYHDGAEPERLAISKHRD